MVDTDAIFRNRTANRARLLACGFTDSGTRLQKQFPILEQQFWMDVQVLPSGAVRFAVFDRALGDEYALVHIESAQGGFVGEVRAACEAVLTDLAQSCFDSDFLKAKQTKRIVGAIQSDFGVAPSFLWADSPDCAAFRRLDNKKWFALIMTVDRSKIGLDGRGAAEIMNMKASPDAVAALLRQAGFYPAYHMNKTHWFAVCLDGSVPDAVLFALLRDSFCSVAKKQPPA